MFTINREGSRINASLKNRFDAIKTQHLIREVYKIEQVNSVWITVKNACYFWQKIIIANILALCCAHWRLSRSQCQFDGVSPKGFDYLNLWLISVLVNCTLGIIRLKPSSILAHFQEVLFFFRICLNYLHYCYHRREII